MKLLNEHWNGFRSSQSLVDAYKTLYRSLGLQIKTVVSCSHSATGLRWCLATGWAWSSPEHPSVDPFPKETGLLLALLPSLGVLLTSRAEPELSPSSRVLSESWEIHQHQNLVQETAGLNWHPCLRKIFPALISLLNRKILVFKLPFNVAELPVKIAADRYSQNSLPSTSVLLCEFLWPCGYELCWTVTASISAWSIQVDFPFPSCSKF